MSHRERLAILDDSIAEYEKVANQAWADGCKLETPRQKELVAIIQEEQLLAGDWHAEQGPIAILQLRADEPHPGLYELLRPEAHSSYPLWEDHTNLRFDDGMVRLEVPTASALQFIQDHGLRVQCDEVARGVAKLIEQLRRLNEVVALCEGQ